jgi:hypothetical protein
VSSAYPIIWAMKHAPVADAEERLILIAMADAADSDGCNSYRSMRSHMLIAKGLSKSTINRRQHAMATRGLIRLDKTPPPARYLKIPKNRRPPRWEICIPYSWWSDAQREEIQRERADKGLPKITPESRPDLPDAPAKKARADKGKPNPKRGRKETRQAEAEQGEDSRGVFKTAQGSNSWGISETPPEVSSRQPRGSLEDTQPSFGDSPDELSSSYGHAAQESQAYADTPHLQEEEGGSRGTERTALGLVDAAAARWVGHRAPTLQERRRLGERVSQALTEGAAPDDVVHALTRDLRADQVRTTAVQVVMGRTARPGWAERTAMVPAPRPEPRPDWCGECDERTRQIEDPDGRARRCPACHPLEVVSVA